MAGPYKLIAIDIDGTLLSPRGEVTPRAREAVQKCLRAGLLVCFATGRNWTESEMVLDAVSHYASAVFVGGAMVVDTGSRVMLHRVLMDPHLARELSREIEAQGLAVSAAQDAHFGHDYVVTSDIPLEEPMASWLVDTKATVHRVPRLADFDHANTMRLTIVAPPASLDAIQRTLDEKFADRIFYNRMSVPHTGVDLIEVFDPSVNKWEGILHVAKKHDVRPEEIVAIGDDFNDLHMIRAAGLGVAMGNARPEIKKLAKRVIGSNHEEGLAKFLEELVEQHQAEPAA